MQPAGLQVPPLHQQPLLTAVGAVGCWDLQVGRWAGQLASHQRGVRFNLMPDGGLGWTAARLWLSRQMQGSMLSMPKPAKAPCQDQVPDHDT